MDFVQTIATGKVFGQSTHGICQMISNRFEVSSAQSKVVISTGLF